MKEENDPDEWWREILLVNEFKEACKKISTSYLKVGDDSMSAICFCTTAKEDLPHLSYILLKAEPRGKSSRLWAVMLLVLFSSWGYIEERKGRRRAITIGILVQHNPLQIGWW